MSYEQPPLPPLVADPSFAPVPLEQQERLRQLVVVKRSLQNAAKRMKVSELTLSKVMSGQNVSRAMRALIAAKLAERDAAGRVP